MSYVTKAGKVVTRRPATQHITPQEAIRRMNEAIDGANERIAEILVKSYAAIELAEQECQQALALERERCEALVSEANAKAAALVAHWQGIAEELGEELRAADERIKALQHELRRVTPKAGKNKRKGRKKRGLMEGWGDED